MTRYVQDFIAADIFVSPLVFITTGAPTVSTQALILLPGYPLLNGYPCMTTRGVRNVISKSSVEFHYFPSVQTNYGHFEPKTLRTLNTSALVWWI